MRAKIVKQKRLHLKAHSLLRNVNWNIASLAAAGFWYLGLFPGRVGYDSVQAINLMREDQSTDWWTAWYFRILEFSTFRGNSIWFASLISLCTLYLTLKYFIFSLPIKKVVLEKANFILCMSPLFGNFAVTVSHDTFFTSGILLLVGYSFRSRFDFNSRMIQFAPMVIAALLLTSKSGYIALVAFLAFLLIRRTRGIRVFIYICFTLSLFALSNLGISKTSVPLEIMPAVADLKCVTQHPEADISDSEWNFLATINPKENWKEPVTCSSMDEALIPLSDSNIESVDRWQFLQYYFSIASKNPAIVIQAHLQRSSVALPPPFFQGPQNQVDQNIRNPIGLNTNTALQLGPEVLHPSIDDPSLKMDLGSFMYVQHLFLFFSFLINQASWFWGWGGLWLWPTILIPIAYFRVTKFRDLLFVSYPIIINHLFLVLFSPIPAPRYVMSTVLIGLTYTLITAIGWFDKLKSKD